MLSFWVISEKFLDLMGFFDRMHLKELAVFVLKFFIMTNGVLDFNWHEAINTDGGRTLIYSVIDLLVFLISTVSRFDVGYGPQIFIRFGFEFILLFGRSRGLSSIVIA